MAKQKLTGLPLSALMKLRDRVGTVIDRRVKALRRELRSLGEDYKEVGRIAIYGKKKTKARKRRRKTGSKSAAGRPAAAKKTRKRSA